MGSSASSRRNWCAPPRRSEEHTSELQSLRHLVCRLLLEKKRSLFLTGHINPLICRHEFDPDIGPGPFDLETRQYGIIRSNGPVNQWLALHAYEKNLYQIRDARVRVAREHRRQFPGAGHFPVRVVRATARGCVVLWWVRLLLNRWGFRPVRGKRG